MADFVAVLRKTINGLEENTPEIRQKVYEKARATIAAKIAAISPPPPPVVVQRQMQALDAAIDVVEAEYIRTDTPDEEEDDLEDVLANFGKPMPMPAPRAPTTAATNGQGVAGAESDAFRDDLRDHQAEPNEAELEPIVPARRAEPPLSALKSHRASTDEPLLAGAPRSRPKRSYAGLMAAVIALVVIGGASYGIWLNRTEFAAMLELDEPGVEQIAAETPLAAPGEPAPAAGEAAPEQQAALAPEAAPPAVAAPDKFTQRLTQTGEEIDEGPAGGTPTVGEGSSVAAATQSGDGAPLSAGAAETPPAAAEAPTAATPEAPSQTPAALPVGQRAIFYEERTSLANGTADEGSIVWSVIQESPGGDLPPEPAVRAEVAIPAKNLQMRLTIRRNADATLPASHIVEMIFLTPENFEGGAISNVLRIAFKPSEEAPGSPLLGIPAKIADGYFLVALSDQQTDIAANLQLLQRQNWIDIPIVYSSGRRALVSIEKGIPGERVFNEAIQSWQQAAAGSAG